MEPRPCPAAGLFEPGEFWAVLRRRGYGTAKAIGMCSNRRRPPDPHQAFSDLSRARPRCLQACAKAEDP